MATTALRGTPVSTSGELPDVGDHAPEFTLTSTSLADVSSEGLVGSRVVLNIFPSVDTGVCAASVRRFNELAGSLDNTTVVNVSLDLPFALSRFCGAEGIENVTSASAFRSTFGDDYGVRMVDGGLRGLFARSIVVLDTDGTVLHTQVVPEIAQEPDYDAAINALSSSLNVVQSGDVVYAFTTMEPGAGRLYFAEFTSESRGRGTVLARGCAEGLTIAAGQTLEIEVQLSVP